MKSITFLIALAVGVLLVVGCGDDDVMEPTSPPQPLYDESTFPSSTWINVLSAEVHMDGSKIEEALEYAFRSEHNTQGVVVIRHGVIVAERYAVGRDMDTPATSWSTAKSFVSALVGIAIDQGAITSIDQPVADYITEWQNTDKSEITIRALLEMRAGLSLSGTEEITALYILGGDGGDQVATSINRTVVGPPMVSWVYQNANSMLLGEIVARATEQSIGAYVQDRLFRPIGMDAAWWTDAEGHAMTYCCIDATTRAFARFGLLYARDGMWMENQIVSPEWVQQSTAEYEAGSGYGLHWVANDENNVFLSAGLHENNIYVFPEEDIVVVRNSIYNQQGLEKVRTGLNFHETLDPGPWDNFTFLQLIIDSVMD